MTSHITDTEMLGRLRDSEAWQEIERADSVKRETERNLAVQTLKDVAVQVAKERPPLDRAIAVAEKDVAAATATLIAAQQAAAKARAARHVLLSGSSTQAAHAESVLRRHAPPELRGFLDWAETERQQLRRGGVVTSREIPGAVNLITMKRTPRVASNAASITDRMTALNQAIKAAHALQVAPLSVDEVRAEVIALRKSIPAIATYAS